MSWQKLKELIQSTSYSDFEKLAARLLELHLETPFVVARSGDQPRGDARSMSGAVSMQAKRYTGEKPPNAKTIEGDIREAIRESPHLQVYVLAVTRDTEQLSHTLDAIARETGLDIVTLELSDELSDLGALCVTFWDNIHSYFDFSDPNREFSTWVQTASADSKTKDKMRRLYLKLKDGIQTQKHVREDVEKHLFERFGTDEGFNPINLSEAIERPTLESEILAWWENQTQPVCCLEGEEGNGKTWLAAKSVNSISEKENIVTFWLDSKDWGRNESLFDLLHTAFKLTYPSYEEEKITKLQNKAAKIWHKTLIVLDGVNERGALAAAQRMLDEYFRHESKWRDKIRFLLTTRPLLNYPDFERPLWNKCYCISVETFNDTELMEALNQTEFHIDGLPTPLRDIARTPRYLRRCIELRDELGSFDVVTKGMVLLADLLDKIEHSDPQIRETLGWSRTEDPKEFFLHLAQQMDWDKIDAAPEKLGQSVKNCFSNYSKIRQDLEEQRIIRKAGLFNVELSDDYVLLCWALYLSNLFDCAEFTGIKEFIQDFQNVLEPIPSEDLRTEALFLALQISAISPDAGISEDQLSQKRAALILAWSNSHNASVTDDRLSYWTEKDSDAYAQVVEYEFENHNVPKYEEMLIEPLARTWLNEKGQIDRLAARLKKWLLPTHSVNSPENRVYTDFKGHPIPMKLYDSQVQLSAAALLILSQRPDCQFLETLARCHEILERYESPDKNIGVLMRWGYTETVLEDLCSLAEQAQTNDELLLRGVYGLAASLDMVDLPPLLQRPLSKEEKEIRASVEQRNRRTPINRLRNQEQLLIGDSPEANMDGNYHGLDYLAVRTDLPCLTEHDKSKIKKLLHHISVNAELGRGRAASRQDFCIESLMPWVAKYDPESYAELAYNLKMNTLNHKWAQFKLSSIQGLIFKSEDCREITEAILGLKQRLVQEIQRDNSSSDTIYLTSLLTEILLFSAPEDKLTDWFEFLALHEPLRISICSELQRSLLEELLPEPIVRIAQQKLESFQSSSFDNQDLPSSESKEFSEDDFWFTLYTYGIRNNKNTVKWALEDLKTREPDLERTLPILRLALGDSNQFLAETLTDEKVREHLLSKHGKKFILPVYDGEDNVPAYDTLKLLFPLEIVGYFLCVPNRQDDLSRWGRELMEWLCSILQGTEGDFDSVRELGYTFSQEAFESWAGQNKIDFLQLTDEYLTRLSKSPRYYQALWNFTNTILCLLLRFQPDRAVKYYREWNPEGSKTVYLTHYGVETFFVQLWQIEDCNLPEHHHLRCELLDECLNDEEIMFMTLAALAGGGEDELWNLVTQKYLVSPSAKERNLGVAILPWFGTCDAIKELKRLISSDQSKWVREHAAWAYEVAQQERSCREVYWKALQTCDPFQISAAFERIKPALSPTAQWYRHKDKEKVYEELQNCDPKLLALVERFWHRWENSLKTKRNFEVFGRKLREYCRGEKFLAGRTPRIAPWWKPTSDYDSL